MDVHTINTNGVDAPASGDGRDEWVKTHVRQLQQIYKQWQQPIGIDSQAYRKHLEKELAGCWGNPLLRSLIETI